MGDLSSAEVEVEESLPSAASLAVQASGTWTTEALAKVEPSLQLGSLLRSDHPQRGSDSASEVDYAAAGPDALAEYMAASTIGHSMDAWSYFAEAVRALVLGHDPLAQHLLYYSELRSAMSILARHGILIRANNHLVLDGGRNVLRSKAQGTHEAVWDYLNGWLRSPAAKEFFLGSISLGSVPATQWLADQKAMGTLSMFEVFQRLGYDLSRFKKDRAQRNRASYGPRIDQNGLNGFSNWFVDDVAGYWRMLEPTDTAGFIQIDQVLCAQLLISARRQAKQSVQHEALTREIRELADRVGSDTATLDAAIVESVVRTAADPSPVRFAFVADPRGLTAEEQMQAMAGRAFVLARYSSAAVENLMRGAGLNSTDLDPWYAQFGRDKGLWTDGESVLDRLEAINEDVRAVLEDAPAASRYEFLATDRGGLFRTLRFEFASVWARRHFSETLPTVFAA